MELRQLRYFVGVAEHESFTRASEDLAIAQPALSAQVAKLEAEIGVDLFERAGRRVRLTESGRLVLEQARRALRAADDVERVARLGARGLVGRLTLGYSRVFPARILTAVLRSYRRRRPDVALDLREMPSVDQISALRNGEIDCAFLRLVPDCERRVDEFEILPVPDQRVTAAVDSRHRLAKRRSVALAEFAGDDWVMFGRNIGESINDDIVERCRQAGFTPRIVQEATDVRIVLGFVAAGLGVTLVTSAARDLGIRGLHYLAVMPKTVLRFAAVTRRDATSAALAALAAEIRSAGLSS
ncbi:LysR family transcriptional regulator [Vulcanimicrobium alpinum]|uniref:LysR family transcriptional regulator n=1 Tax=Vulcanimicrobium alpinum TaxID=3016050 RepID=A0AAN1XW73_UNVUL|nr:LysR family transcriptional regulator [Vulcanimicrobium alpinum]BDE06115.1 LysR family transcriptional regulator [Vulcanimicrobium alpinum]